MFEYWWALSIGFRNESYAPYTLPTWWKCLVMLYRDIEGGGGVFFFKRLKDI